MPAAVFEGERAGAERQRVELQRAGGGAGLEGRQVADPGGAFSGLRAEVRTFVVHLLLRHLQQLEELKKNKSWIIKDHTRTI